ncbi:Hypothetical predicted protein, partial [Marmota monax]
AGISGKLIHLVDHGELLLHILDLCPHLWLWLCIILQHSGHEGRQGRKEDQKDIASKQEAEDQQPRPAVGLGQILPFFPDTPCSQGTSKRSSKGTSSVGAPASVQ